MKTYPYEVPRKNVFDLMVDIVIRIINEKGCFDLDPRYQEQYHELNNRWKQMPPNLRAKLTAHFKEAYDAFELLPTKNEVTRADMIAAGEELAMAAAAIVSLKDAVAQLNHDRVLFAEEQIKMRRSGLLIEDDKPLRRNKHR